VCWLIRIKEWQDLIAGVVGAAALIWTVRWTLTAERRRQDKEAQSLRTALGAELRRFAQRSISGHEEFATALRAADDGTPIKITAVQAGNFCRFPQPFIYLQSANNIGTLSEYADKVVYFYGQLSLIWEQMRLRQNEEVGPGILVTRDQLYVLAKSLLNAAEAAAEALPAFRAEARAPEDATFIQQVHAALVSFAKSKAPAVASRVVY
jgi:hypothetical protein